MRVHLSRGIMYDVLVVSLVLVVLCVFIAIAEAADNSRWGSEDEVFKVFFREPQLTYECVTRSLYDIQQLSRDKDYVILDDPFAIVESRLLSTYHAKLAREARDARRSVEQKESVERFKSVSPNNIRIRLESNK